MNIANHLININKVKELIHLKIIKNHSLMIHMQIKNFKVINKVEKTNNFKTHINKIIKTKKLQCSSQYNKYPNPIKIFFQAKVIKKTNK